MIYHQSCLELLIGPRGIEVSGKLDLPVSNNVQLNTNFGFMLIATLGDNLAISFQNSSLYLYNGG